MAAHTDPPVGLTGARFGRVSRYAESPTERIPEDVGERTAPDDLPPPTGARFARPPRQGTRPEPPPPARQEPPLTDQQPPAPPPRPGPPGPDPSRPDESGYDPGWSQVPGPDPGRPEEPEAYSHWPDASEPDPDTAVPTVRVRPYVHTGGRTRSQTPLPIEALVCATPGASPLRLHGTHRSVLELCREPQSVAEVSARLGVPLAVARVLVDDLVAQRMVTVQRGVDQSSPDLVLMRRVLAGLRQL